MLKSLRKSKGFTLIEVLLVVAIIAILAGIVILAVNPTKQLGDTRNAERKANVATILDAVYQYSIDNNGALPAGIPTTAPASPSGPGTTATTNDICATTDTGTQPTCTGIVNLHGLTDNGKYLVAIPTDPSCGNSTDSGYEISQDSNGRLTVYAPCAEQGQTITATR